MTANKDTPASAGERKGLVFQKEIHISWKKPEGGHKLVILNLNDGDFYSLEDPVSIGIWEGLMAGRNPVTILEELTRAYAHIEPAQLAKDMDNFLGELLANRLISPCLPSGGSA